MLSVWMILGNESNWASIRRVRNEQVVSESLGVPYPASMGEGNRENGGSVEPLFVVAGLKWNVFAG